MTVVRPFLYASTAFQRIDWETGTLENALWTFFRATNIALLVAMIEQQWLVPHPRCR